jgi:hypothetical protein
LDEPIAPSQRGMFDFSCNVSSTVQQERRELVFAMGREELIDAAVKPRNSLKRYAILGVSQEFNFQSGFERIDLMGGSPTF